MLIVEGAYPSSAMGLKVPQKPLFNYLIFTYFVMIDFIYM